MSVGRRLKEERLRIGLSQTDFAALAGASKGAQLKWEKDEASPNANALIAFGAAGVDVQYVLTGAVPIQIEHDWGAQDMLDNLEKKLDTVTNASDYDPSGATSKNTLETLETIRKALAGIATSPSPDVLEPARLRADNLLRRHFDDEEAGARRSKRLADLMTRRQHLSRDLQDVLVASRLELPRDLVHNLLQLMLEYQIAMPDIVPTLSELAKLTTHSNQA